MPRNTSSQVEVAICQQTAHLSHSAQPQKLTRQALCFTLAGSVLGGAAGCPGRPPSGWAWCPVCGSHAGSAGPRGCHAAPARAPGTHGTALLRVAVAVNLGKRISDVRHLHILPSDTFSFTAHMEWRRPSGRGMVALIIDQHTAGAVHLCLNCHMRSTSAAALEVVDVEDGLHLWQQILCQLPNLGVEQRRVVARPDTVQLACAVTGKVYLSTWAHTRSWILVMLLQPVC